DCAALQTAERWTVDLVGACGRSLGDRAPLIALGHPIGCTGSRITVTLLHEMMKRNTKRGVATLCVSGGMGMALALENVV
ncbi:MAG: hypothetical protein ACLPM3_02555, partial [Terracidiphilus sp.]